MWSTRTRGCSVKRAEANKERMAAQTGNERLGQRRQKRRAGLDSSWKQVNDVRF